MLGKLLKFDLKNMVRSFIPISIVFAALEIMMIFSAFSDGIGNDAAAAFSVFSTLIIVPTYLVFIALTVIIPAKRFNSCINSDSSFLMMTIPVRPVMHIISKLICTVILYIAAMIYCGLVTVIGLAAVNGFEPNFSFVGDSLMTGDFLYLSLSTICTLIFAQSFFFMACAISGAFQKGSGMLTALICILGIIANGVLSSLYQDIIYTALDIEYFPMFSLFGRLLHSFESSYDGIIAMCVYHGAFAALFFYVTYLIIGKKYNLYR